MSSRQTFAEWYRRRDQSDCPLAVGELIALLDELDVKPHELRRTVLQQIRANLARDPERVTADTVLARRFNEWREQLARQYLEDQEISSSDRVEAAIRVLLKTAAPADDLQRPQTLALAGQAYAQRGTHRADRNDLLTAAAYFERAWRADPSLRNTEAVLHASLLWLRIANHCPPADANRHRDDLRALTEELAHVAERALHSAAERAQAIRVSAGGAAPIAPHPDQAWERLTALLDAIVSTLEPKASEKLQAAFGEPLGDAWDAALAMMFANAARGRWEQAHAWAKKVARSSGPFVLVGGSGVALQQRWEAAVRAIVEIAALLPKSVQGPREDVVTALAGLLEPAMRDRLSEWFVQHMQQESDSPEAWFAHRSTAVDRSKTYPLEPVAVGALVCQLLRSTRRGRIGLAMSGGGFRASFFHLGVLARLAEVDLLRTVEVISCVSGGSIIGACYYLKLKRLLEERHDVELTREDYIDLVESLCRVFLAGVQRNIRTRIFASWRGILRLWFSPGYTRTHRVAELLESELLARAAGNGNGRVSLRELAIKPKGEHPRFDPRRDNWHRASKVPQLVINATTINTGHNFQFTGFDAGEPPFAVDRDADATPRLRAFVYRDPLTGSGPPASQSVTLGFAAAASACVPGIFPPLPLPETYHNMDVRLVDGGLFDNQGFSALIDNECDVIIASDGSGQLYFDRSPSSGTFSTLGRTNAILMERVRQLQFRNVLARRVPGSSREVVAVHLTKGLDNKPVEWLGFHNLDDDLDPTWDRLLESAESLVQGVIKFHETPYGIAEDIQRLLAGVRTDLDSFHQCEAYALFWSGYRMAAHDLSTSSLDPPVAGSEQEWSMARAWKRWGRTEHWNIWVTHVLNASRYRFFKAARLEMARVKWSAALVLAVLAVLGWLLRDQTSAAVGMFGGVLRGVSWAIGAAATVATIYAGVYARQRSRFLPFAVQTFKQLLAGFGLPFIWMFSRAHLSWFDPAYQLKGNVDLFEFTMTRRDSAGPPNTVEG